ncbi:hypothetical protein GCM10029978_088520 [Actinoallomurus acanthiterrae]
MPSGGTTPRTPRCGASPRPVVLAALSGFVSDRYVFRDDPRPLVWGFAPPGGARRSDRYVFRGATLGPPGVGLRPAWVLAALGGWRGDDP